MIFISFWEFRHRLLLKNGWLWVTEAVKTREKGKHNETLFVLRKGGNHIICESMNLRHHDKSNNLFLLNCSYLHPSFQDAFGNRPWPRLIVPLHLTYTFSGRFLFTEEAGSIRDIRSICITKNVKWVVVWSIPKKTGRGSKCCLFLALKYWSEKEGFLQIKALICESISLLIFCSLPDT